MAVDTRLSNRWVFALVCGVLVAAQPAAGTTLLRLDMKQLSLKAQVIVVGKVTAVQAQPAPGGGQGPTIVTNVSMQVRDALKGAAPGARVTFTVPGGRAGNVAQMIPGVPRFRVGEEALVFLEPTPLGTLGVVGWRQGKYTISKGKLVGTGLTLLQAKTLIKRYIGAPSGPGPKGRRGPAVEEPVPGLRLPGVSPALPGRDAAKRRARVLRRPVMPRTVAIMGEDFEGLFPQDNNWTLSGNPTWGKTDYTVHGGGSSAWCAAGGTEGLDPYSDNYPNYMDAWMVWGPFDLSDAWSAELTFWLWLDAESGFDYFCRVASHDGVVDPNFVGWGGWATTGGTGGWVQKTLDLADWLGDSSVWVALVFQSDFSITYKGAFVDDIVLTKETGVPCSISGNIQYNVSDLAGVTVSLSNGSFMTTGPDGDYVFSWVLPGTYTVTPTKAGYTFSPSSRDITVTESAPDGTGDFTANQGIGDGTANYWAVLVGISDYAYINDLNYCDDDAIDVRAALLASVNWHVGNIQLLTDSEATKANIYAALQAMASNADADDVCLYFHSGHGTTYADAPPMDEADGLDEALCTYLTGPSPNECIWDDEFGSWLNELPTSRYVVIVDTCFSGGQIKGAGQVKGIGSARPSPGDGFAADIVKLWRAWPRDLDDNLAGVVLTACDDDEYSYESGALQNGVFSYYLVEGLIGPADANGDQQISAEEAYYYAAPLAAAFAPQNAQLYDAYPPADLDIWIGNYPPAITTLTAQDHPDDNGGAIDLDWSGYTAPPDFDHYNIYRSESSFSDVTAPGVTLVGTVPTPSQTTYTDAPTTDGTDYYYAVTCVDTSSNEDTSVTRAGPVQSSNDLPPPPITALTAADHPGDNGGAIDLDWTGYSAPPDFHHYNIYRSTSSFSDVSGMPPIGAVMSASQTTYTDAPTTDGTDYYYAVTCVDKADNQDTSVTSVGPVQSVDNDVAPPPITTLTAGDHPDDNGGAIDLDWTGYSAPPDFYGYKIYRSTSSFSDVSGMPPIGPVMSASQTTYTDGTTIDGTEYYYAVTCVDSAGNEDTSVTCVGPVQSVDNGHVVTFADPNLEAAIREAINKPTGDIYRSDLLGLTTLDAGARGISDLSGLEHCGNLSDLFLGGNQIGDISPLAGLSNLWELWLGPNNITDIGPLAGLSNLNILWLSSNQITDIGPLAGLSNLGALFLESNQITDIGPLAGLSGLATLWLDANQITDIGPLAGLSNLSELLLQSNHITDISALVANSGLGWGDWIYLQRNWLDLSPGSQASQDVETLRNRGASVHVDNQNPPPPRVTALTAQDHPSDSGGAIDLDWTGYAAPADFDRYNIYRSTASFSDVTGMTPIGTVATASQMSYTDGTTTDGIDYYYAVTCVDTGAREDRSVTCVGPVQSVDNGGDVAPAPITTLTAQDHPNDNGGAVDLDWAGYVAPSDFDHYNIYRSTSSFSDAMGMTPIGTVTDPAQTSYTDSPTVDGTDYYYAVTCADTGANEDKSVTCVGPVQSLNDSVPPPITALGAQDHPNDTGGAIDLDWTGYSAPPDFDEYRIYRDTTSFSDVSGMTPIGTLTDPGQTTYTDSPTVDGTDYYYAVTCVDSAANEDTSVTCVGPVQSIDNIPPDPITTLTAQDHPADNGGAIDLDWTGYAAPADFDRYNIYRSTASFSDVSIMPPIATVADAVQTTYTDATAIDGTDYYYGVTCVDSTGNEDTSVTCVGPVQSVDNIGVVHDLPVAGYYMISFPLRPNSAAPHDLLCDDLGDGNYYMWRWDPVAQTYETIWTVPDPPGLPPPPGCDTPLNTDENGYMDEGYWILTPASTIDMSGTPPLVDQTILLRRGWNIVAAPAEATMDSLRVAYGGDERSLAQAQNAGWVLATFYYSHDGTGSYSMLTIGEMPPDQLSLWTGYWVLAGIQCSLIVPVEVGPPPPPPVGGGPIMAAARQTAGRAWAFDIQARSADSLDSITIAAADGASDDFDGFALDKPKPPSAPGEDRLRMVLREGWRGTEPPPYNKAPGRQMPWASELATETKGTAQEDTEWQLTVTGGVQGEPVTLTWPDLSQLPKDRVAILTDRDAGKRSFMRSRAQYEFAAPGDGASRSFTVTVKPAHEGALLISGLTAAPTRGGTWDIGFNLSADAAVTGRVYNVAGRRVADIAQAQQLARGRASLVWDSRSIANTHVPSGVYLLRVTARTEEGEQASAVTMLQVSR